MKKIFFLFIVTFFTVISSISQYEFETKAQTSTDVYVHYHRYDNNYANWDVWIWEHLPNSRGGKAFAFNGTDEFGPYAKFNLSEVLGYSASTPPTTLGFIIKQGNWTDREPGGDRYIQVTNTDSSGSVHIYIIQSDPKVYKSRLEADISPKIIQAGFKDFTHLTFRTTATISSTSGLKVYKGNTQVEVKEASVSTDFKSGQVTLSDKIDVGSDYFIELPGFSNLKYIEKRKLYDTVDFNNQYVYTNNDLGATYTKDDTEFRVWAPTASEVDLVLYQTGDYRKGSILDETAPLDLIDTYSMTQSEKGTWVVKISQDLNHIYYNYKVRIGDLTTEAVDPYAKALGVNGHRGMVLNLEETNPLNWTNNKPTLEAFEDSIIYELHVRDLSIHSSSNIKNKGKFLGLTETGTKYNDVTTGIDHLVELGITHLHLLPSFDFRSIDETKTTPQFNWGYDPLNYNAPEGTFSTDPYLGEVRVSEFKQMVQALHDNGIRVVMDVVYNHLGEASTSSFEKIVPGYYFRYNEFGQYTNGSGVGNETASERQMMRKFIVDSVKYWAEEYHVDGFRFDLMAVHDITTMNEVRNVLTEIDPTIIVYGEGWTGGDSALPENLQATRFNVRQMPQIAVFNDVTRDGIKGSVWSETDKGFVQGAGREADVKFGIVGGITHSQVRTGWANDPEQIINYAEAHDNYTLWDKLTVSQKGAVNVLKEQQHKQAAAIVLTSQGIPFLQAGQDFLRSKPHKGEYNENSYNAPDIVNQLRWDYKEEHEEIFNYYKGLIALRKAHPSFRMRSTEDIQNNLQFIDTGLQNVIAYTLTNNSSNDDWKTIVVAFNSSSKTQNIKLPNDTTYHIVVDRDQAGVDVLRSFEGDTLTVRANESIVAYVGEARKPLLQSSYLLILLSGLIGLGVLAALVFTTLKRRDR